MNTLPNFLLLLTLLLTITQTTLACPYDECKQNIDCGSCGNACCTLILSLNLPSETVMHTLKSSIMKNKGPDGQYTGQHTHGGHWVFDDLRKYDKGVDYIGQVWHLTANRLFNDTINIAISSKGDDVTEVKAFSISQLGGSFCDDGQNYYNIVNLFENFFEKGVARIVGVHGCGHSHKDDLSVDAKEKEKDEYKVNSKVEGSNNNNNDQKDYHANKFVLNEKYDTNKFMSSKFKSVCKHNEERCIYNDHGDMRCCIAGETCIKGVGCRC